MLDSHHTGYVTLDELINFRDSLRVRNGELDQQMVDMNGHNQGPDLSKSLLALYHFDVALDGHFTFEEFLLLQAYLQDVEHDNDGAVVCRCIPKNWLKASWWRKKLKAHRHRKYNGKREFNGPEGPEDEHPLTMPDSYSKKSVRTEGEERVITRRVNDHGELHEIACDDLECSFPVTSPPTLPPTLSLP